jgi:hypothetical protein
MMNILLKTRPSHCNLKSKAIPVFLLAQLETRVQEVQLEFEKFMYLSNLGTNLDKH